ncbi:MAG: alpha-L-arabinofuranosidase C-terminal domain-containing protein [Bacteroidota bacterium]
MKKAIILLFFVINVNVIVAQKAAASIVLNVDLSKDTISRHIYGQFSEHLGSCIYGGIWVGENSTIPNTRGIRNDVVAALRKINIPNLRWPGGCFADEYHWMDGIGPRDKRPKMINTHWGGVVEDNSFGTHEFMDLCEQLNTEPYICGNVGSGSVEEMSKWVEYLTFDGESPMSKLRKENGREKPWKIKFWGVGNENWGCGGNMSAEFYADNYKRYATYCRNYGSNRLFRIAGGPYGDDVKWMETLLKNVNSTLMQGVSLHYYTVRDWSKKGSATDFNESDYFTTLVKCFEIDNHLAKQITIMDKYDPKNEIGLMVDEWGNWFDVEPGTNPGFLYQQNTLRDAITCAVNLNIFNNRSGRVKMANIAQMVNVLQALILTDGPKMVLTPTYYVYEMFKVHHDAALIPINMKSPSYQLDGKSVPMVNVSASKDKNGKVHITLVNVNPNQEIQVECDIRGADKISKGFGRIITSKELNSFNTFDKPDNVVSADFNNFEVTSKSVSVKIPAKSIILIGLN